MFDGIKKGLKQSNKRSAIILILLFGVISLLGDVIYEGAHGVNGQYLQTMGASAAAVGLIAGLAELLGYVIRIISGYFSDRTRSYWILTIIGYGLLAAVPMLALAGVWQIASVFIVIERMGKGIRSPARDTILSHAAKQVGTGTGFAAAEFLDQIGATIGPLIFTFFFISLGNAQKSAADYGRAYSLMWLPFIMLMVALFAAYTYFRNPEKLEKAAVNPAVKKKESRKLPRTFWLYTLFSFFTTLGFINFAIVGYHLKANNLLSDAQIPLFYAIAMMIDAVAGLAAGRLYDRIKSKNGNEYGGLLVLAVIPLLTAIIPFFIVSRAYYAILIGIFVWGIVMGTHETIMKAGIADITSIKNRGTAYGIFNAGYGIALFIGSAAAGFLYERSIYCLVLFIVASEVVSAAVYLMMRREVKSLDKMIPGEKHL